uniref:Uncharacterized protein n=1 Tax=Heterorhabditis bacteriophora TaxID=37862 RepID=A0A1I7WLB4_HETBA
MKMFFVYYRFFTMNQILTIQWTNISKSVETTWHSIIFVLLIHLKKLWLSDVNSINLDTRHVSVTKTSLFLNLINCLTNMHISMNLINCFLITIFE